MQVRLPFWAVAITLINASVAPSWGADAAAAVARVDFLGNQHISDETLREHIRPRDFKDPQQLASAISRLERACRNEGFVRCKTGKPEFEVREQEVRDHFPRPFGRKVKQITAAKIAIQEGERYRFGSLELPDLEVLDATEGPPAGSFFSETEIDRLRRDVEVRLIENGILASRLEVSREIDDQELQVHLLLLVEFLPPLDIVRIDFQGHQTFPDRFYRRELDMAEGDVLDPRRIARSIERLNKTGALVSIDGNDFEIRPDLQHGEAEIIIQLREKKRQKILFSAEPGSGLQLSLIYSVANLLGLGEKLGLDLSLGSASSEAAIQLASKYFMGTTLPVMLGLRIFHRQTSLKLPGLEDKLGRLLGRRSATGIQSAVGLRVSPQQQAGLLFEVTQVEGFDNLKLALSPSWELSGGDPPSQRVRMTQRFAFQPDGRTSLRNDLTFSRSFDSTSQRRPHAGFRFHFAHVSGLSAQPVPFSERIVPDRLELRGFPASSGPWTLDEGAASPAGSEILATFASQYSIPIADQLTMVPFFDAGLSASPGAIESTNRILRASLGTEIRLRPAPRMPAARIILAWNPLRLDSLVATAKGSARLRDPRFAFRIGW